jgi:hypothetical protein
LQDLKKQTIDFAEENFNELKSLTEDTKEYYRKLFSETDKNFSKMEHTNNIVEKK